MKKVFLILLALIMIVGCSTYYNGTYTLALKEVERPEDAKVRYGQYEIVSFEEEAQTKYSYEDEMIRIVWLPLEKQFAFQLDNKTNHSIKIIWDEAVYINQNGSSERIVHSGVKYTDMNNSQPPSIVVRNTNITDMVVPTGNIRYVSGQYDPWKISPLVSKISASTIDDLITLSTENIGKTISILLPLQIENVVNEYIFKFNVNEFVVDPTERISVR